MSRGDYPDRDPQLFYELARDRHAAQADVLASLDSKLTFYLSASGGLLGILVAVFALRPDAFDAAGLVLTIASGLAWLLLTGTALKSLGLVRWKAGPKLDEVSESYRTDESDWSRKWRVAESFQRDYEENKPLEEGKACALKWALRLFIAQILLLVLALVLLALSDDSDTSRRSQKAPGFARQTPTLVGSACLSRRPAVGLVHPSARDPIYAASGIALARLTASDNRANIVRSA
jgi:hypothetical protein